MSKSNQEGSEDEAPTPAKTSAGGDTSAPTGTPGPLPSWMRHWPYALASVGGLVVGYGGGRIQGSFALDDAEVRHEAAMTTCEGEKETLAGEAEDLRGRLELLEARRLLHRASLALEEHNYGIAQERVQASLPLLRKQEALSSVADELAAESFLEPGKAEALRGKLREAIVAFDATWSEGE